MDEHEYELEEGEESAWSNVKGYFSLLSNLMFSVSKASIMKDLQLLLDVLNEQYVLIRGYYNEDERKVHDNKIIKAQNEINLYVQYEQSPRAQLHYTQARRLLEEIKRSQVLMMHNNNLLSPRRQKGELAIYS